MGRNQYETTPMGESGGYRTRVKEMVGESVREARRRKIDKKEHRKCSGCWKRDGDENVSAGPERTGSGSGSAREEVCQ